MPKNHMNSPVTHEAISATGRATLAACQAGCQFEPGPTLSAMTLAAATMIHHSARDANIARSGLLDQFFEGLVTCLNEIDQNEARDG